MSLQTLHDICPPREISGHDTRTAAQAKALGAWAAALPDDTVDWSYRKSRYSAARGCCPTLPHCHSIPVFSDSFCALLCVSPLRYSRIGENRVPIGVREVCIRIGRSNMANVAAWKRPYFLEFVKHEEARHVDRGFDFDLSGGPGSSQSRQGNASAVAERRADSDDDSDDEGDDGEEGAPTAARGPDTCPDSTKEVSIAQLR